MRRILLLALVALCALPAAALDRSAWAFARYDLQATVDPAQHALAVEGTLELRNRSAQPQREAVLQVSSSLHWAAIRVEGDEVEWLQQLYTSDIDHTGALAEAIVKLPQPVAPGASVKLTVRYQGTITKDATRLTRIGTPAAAALRSDWDEIGANFTAVRGVGFVAWYPVATEAANLERGNELFETLREWHQRQAASHFRLHLQHAPRAEDDTAPFLLVTNSAESKPAAELTAEFHGGEPAFVLLNDPAATEDRPRVSAYYTAAHTNFARDYMAAAERVIPDLEPYFGTPHSRVVLVELTDPNALPYDDGAFYFVPMRKVLAAGAEVALARPVVHAMIESDRPWIREGLAGFAQAQVREHQAGRKAALEYLSQFLSALQVAEAQSQPPTAALEKDKPAEPLATPQPLISTADEVFFRTKSAYVWWMLRDMVGDHPLQAALARYRRADDTDSGVMQRLIEAQLAPGRSLETFFDDWVYRDKGLPQLKIASLNVRRTLGEQTVSAITVENLGNAVCEVPVSVSSGHGESTSRVEVPAHGKGIIRIALENIPVEVQVNDGSVPESEPRLFRATINGPDDEKK